MGNYLEDFSELAIPSQIDEIEPLPASQTNSEPIPGYDDGYEAGWNDALSENAKTNCTAERDIALALQEAGFTYFEARQHVLRTLQPVLEAMVEKLLPDLARASLSAVIMEHLQELSETVEHPIEILCPPDAKVILSKLCEEHIKFPVKVSAEESLDEQQVLFRYADGSADLNMSACLSNIEAAVSGFFESLTEQEKQSA